MNDLPMSSVEQRASDLLAAEYAKACANGERYPEANEIALRAIAAALREQSEMFTQADMERFGKLVADAREKRLKSQQPEAQDVVDEDRALAEAFREIAKCSHAQDGVAGELFQAVRNKAALTAAQQPVGVEKPPIREHHGGELCDATGTPEWTHNCQCPYHAALTQHPGKF